jgi:hypothetical protein
MRWFGPRPWPDEDNPAPVCADDTLRIPIPVGEQCLWCQQKFTAESCGEDMASVEQDKNGDLVNRQRYLHIECAVRQVLGGPAHIQGTCSCQGGTDDPDLGMPPYEAAQWVWRHWIGSQLASF